MNILRPYIRICHIDPLPSAGLEPEKRFYGFRYLPKREYGCHVLLIGFGYWIIELATGEGN